MIEIISWVGAIAISICAVPQAYSCYKQKHAVGISYLFLSLWLVGEVCLMLYSLFDLFSLQLLLNYSINILCILVILFYKVTTTTGTTQ